MKKSGEEKVKDRKRNEGGENGDVALDVASLMITTATDCPNDVGPCLPLDPTTTPGVESRLIAAINIKPTSRDRLFILWPPLLAVYAADG